MLTEHGGSRPVWAVAAVALIAFGAATASAQTLRSDPRPAERTSEPSLGESAIDNPLGIPDLSKMAPTATDSKGVTSTLQILVILTVLSITPSILILTTCFTRIMIVLAMLRQAMGTQQLPPGQVLTGLSLFLTFLVMAPTWQRVYSEALVPYLDKQSTQREAFNAAIVPMREFMIRQIEASQNEETVYMLMEYQRGEPIDDSLGLQWTEVNTVVLIPAYVLSELKAAFTMGFRFYLPFLVIDMVIATILISMGMLMLPPVLISLPFKVALFVLADGWHLVVRSLLTSFG